MGSITASDQTTINFHDSGGDGPAVLLVHGITESAASWAPLVDRLRPDYRVITMDLRGHGASGRAETYDLDAMASDVVALVAALDLVGEVHLVGHSLGGAVVSAAGAAVPVASVVNVDQSLQLAAFKAQLSDVEPMLRDGAAFSAVLEALFAELAGPMLAPDEAERLAQLRSPDQDVVLGVWDVIFTRTADEIDAIIDTTLAGYADRQVPYLALFGSDPGPDYTVWLASRIGGASVELWENHGHYPHLVDPERFVATLEDFWAS